MNFLVSNGKKFNNLNDYLAERRFTKELYFYEYLKSDLFLEIVDWFKQNFQFKK